MTASGNDGDYWSATIAAFAPLHLSEPELTVKLLQKPPFRFIHDIITSINKKYDTFTQVLPQEMLICANIDSKEKKIEYLNTLIRALETMLHIKVEVNPKKIVSGSEPEKTNIFLQSIASAASRSAELLRGTSQSINNTKENRNEEGDKTTTRASESLSSSPHLLKSTETQQTSEVSVQNKNDSSKEKERKKSTKESKNNQMKNVDATKRTEIFSSVKVFNDKIANYALNLNATEKRSISDEGKSIVNMWKDLQQTTIETAPSQLSQEALEMAIKRQIDTIQQISKLSNENDKLVDELEELLL